MGGKKDSEFPLEIGFLCDEVPVTVAARRDTTKWTLHIAVCNNARMSASYERASNTVHYLLPRPRRDVDSQAIDGLFHMAEETEIWTEASSWRPGHVAHDRDRKKSQNLSGSVKYNRNLMKYPVDVIATLYSSILIGLIKWRHYSS
jgi:hypothetical protein